jgi:Cache domain
MWGVLLGAGAITIGFSFLFGTKNTVAQALMTAGLAMTIALVLLSILALEKPFGGITRIEPEAFNQTKDIFDSVPAAQFGTAKAMLERAVAALKEDKAKALDMFSKGEGGFKDRDLYVFCANASDGTLTAHPSLRGEHLQDIKGTKGSPFGQEMMQKATEGTIREVHYWWPRPGTDKPLLKTTFYTKVGDQICGVGYYKG